MSANYYNKIYFDYVCSQGDDTLKTRFPMIFFVHSGELTVECESGQITVGKGESLFFRAGSMVCIKKQDCGLEPFRGIYIGFSKTVLSELQHTIKYKKKLPVRPH